MSSEKFPELNKYKHTIGVPIVAFVLLVGWLYFDWGPEMFGELVYYLLYEEPFVLLTIPLFFIAFGIWGSILDSEAAIYTEQTPDYGLWLVMMFFVFVFLYALFYW